MTDRELMQQALEDICAAKLCEMNSMSSRHEMIRLMDKAINTLRERLAQPEQEQWDAIPDAFNEWWDADYDDTGNPYRKDSPAYWAWSGWKAASKQPAQEPVAWVSESENLLSWDKFYDHMTPLYTAPRQWQGLTRQEFLAVTQGLEDLEDCWMAIEAKLKEKNT
jgi:hypothetical protein